MQEISEQMTRLFGAKGWEAWQTKAEGDCVNLLLTPEVAEDLARILACLNRMAPEVVSRETGH